MKNVTGGMGLGEFRRPDSPSFAFLLNRIRRQKALHDTPSGTLSQPLRTVATIAGLR